MNAQSRDAIRERAYVIWEREGRPHGRELEHWLQAESELAGLVETPLRPKSPRPGSQNGSAPTSRARTSRSPRSKAAKRK
jgi:hypothetical protein